MRPTVSWPVRLGVRPDFYYCRTLRFSCCGAPSLTRGRVRNLLLQFTVTLWSKSHRTHDHILLSHLRLPPVWNARYTYLYPPGTAWPSYTSRHWVPFSPPLMTHRATYSGGILTSLHTGFFDWLILQGSIKPTQHKPATRVNIFHISNLHTCGA
jgi:hypothetical protein